MVDKIKELQVVATSSSVLDMASQINEPLTGRKYEYNVHPFTVEELSNGSSWHKEARNLEQRLVFGFYPDITNNAIEAERLLRSLANSYLYKDLLSFDEIRKPDLLHKLLQALAFQVGSEVSYNELARTLSVDKATITKYIDLLEKVFIIFKVSPYSRNLRSEITTTRKIYFWDNGVRNAVISNFTNINNRTDVGALWENFMISERIKQCNNHMKYARHYFWRTKIQQEIDLIEEENLELSIFEFKWNPKAKAHIPTTFTNTYTVKHKAIVSSQNYQDFIKI